MRRLTPLLALLALLLTPVRAGAGVTVSTSEDHYVVEGSTRAQISRFYQQRETRSAASARPSFKYSYTWRQQGGMCTVTDVKVHLHLLYTYPRLASATGRRTAQWWNDTLKQLTIHERIHGDIARDAAKELERELLRIRDVPCSAIKEKVKYRAERVFQDHQRRQEDYDRLTEHGLKQERHRGD
ncbi:DUF922 domain-containing protein [Pseudodesulfovibrio sp.]|uniref:DUF922 domain-containing protein n=1 Tax=Pseudodesulfovibrio sp. TaxID=2035812 RepID=UPI00262B7FC7|nr:DUF922 domain-containing protein [Pseudodesulfovibrio sp.]